MSHLASSCTSSGITQNAITLTVSTLWLRKKVATMRGIFQEQVYMHLFNEENLLHTVCQL